MSRVYLVNRDTVMSKSGNKFVPFLFEFQRPAEYLKSNYGYISCTQSDFFKDISSNLKEEDVVVIFISLENEEHVKKLSDCKAKKVLRVIDPSKSDKILFKKPLELHEKVGFDAFAICYPNKDHIKCLQEKGLKVIVWPHSLEFSNAPPPNGYNKKGVWVSAGQQHEKFYPCRWNLTNILYKNFGNQGVLLPHPGYDVDNLRHPYVGEKFLNFISDFVFMPVGVGINDGFHMKFVEAAWGNVLPIGTVPSYLPDLAKEIIPLSNLDPLSYNEQEVVEELNRLLNQPEELITRIRNWRQWVEQMHDLSKVQQHFAKQIEEIVK